MKFDQIQIQIQIRRICICICICKYKYVFDPSPGNNIGSSGIVVVIRLYSITWAKIYPFLCCHIVPLGHNELGHLLWDDCAFSCDQAALRTPLSVCPSIRLSVTPFYPSARIGLEGYCRRLPGGRVLPHTITALPGAILIGSWSNLVGTNVGAGSRTCLLMGDVAR